MSVSMSRALGLVPTPPPRTSEADAPAARSTSTSDPRPDLARDRAEAAPAARETARPRAARADAAIEGAARAYLAGGGHTVRAYMRSHPREMAALGALSEGELSSRMQSAIAQQDSGLRVPLLAGSRDFLRAQSATGAVVAEFEQVARERVRGTARAALDEQIDTLTRSDPREALAALHAAPADSALGHLRESLGLRGDEGDLAQLEMLRDRTLDAMRELRGTLVGGAWDPAQLPASRDRVARALGVEDAPGGSIASRALDTPRGDLTGLSHTIETALEVAELSAAVLETGHAALELYAVGALAEGAAVVGTGAAGSAVVAGGIAVGVAISHEVHERQLDRFELALLLGL